MTLTQSAPVPLRKRMTIPLMLMTRVKEFHAALLLGWLVAFCGGCATPPPPTMQSRADADLHTLGHALTRYHHVLGRWPENGEGLSALVERHDPATKRRFLARVPVDPWGNRYQYRFNPVQGHVTVWSFGEDVVSSTDDIRSELRIR